MAPINVPHLLLLIYRLKIISNIINTIFVPVPTEFHTSHPWRHMPQTLEHSRERKHLPNLAIH